MESKVTEKKPKQKKPRTPGSIFREIIGLKYYSHDKEVTYGARYMCKALLNALEEREITEEDYNIASEAVKKFLRGNKAAASCGTLNNFIRLELMRDARWEAFGQTQAPTTPASVQTQIYWNWNRREQIIENFKDKFFAKLEQQRMMQRGEDI